MHNCEREDPPRAAACQERYQRFCQRYSSKKKAQRVCAWGSRLFPLGLSKHFHRVFPGRADLFVVEGAKQRNRVSLISGRNSSAAPPPSPPPMPDAWGDEDKHGWPVQESGYDRYQWRVGAASFSYLF